MDRPPVALDHVRLDVADIEISQRFYAEILGLQPVVRYDLTDRIILQLGRDGTPPGVELWQQFDLTPAPHPTQHVAFRTEDVPGLIERVRELGYPVLTDPYRIGAETVAFVEDPDGHSIELNDFRGRPVGNTGALPAAYLGQLYNGLTGLDLGRVTSWGARLAALRRSGGRLLVAGNGGSAAQAQHLTAELVGRFEAEREPMSALALHADTSTVTAVSNDYGYDQVFARQVRAHGRSGDVLLTLSGSGRSPNLIQAVAAARERGLITWALTGPVPNPLAALVDEVVAVPATATSTVQECHLVAIHLLCAALDATTEPVAPEPPVVAGPVRPPEPAPLARPGPARPSIDSARSLTVVGDAFLDRDHDGRVERVCSDDPALVVSDGSTLTRPGGAALAALLLARQGHAVSLVTALGTDEVGATVAAMMTAAGIRLFDLGLDGPTATKTRIRAAGRTLLMLDEQSQCPPIRTARAGVLRAALDAADAVLVADYGRGITAAPEVRISLTEAARGRPLVWDPHPRGTAPVAGTRIVTPSAREAEVLAGRESSAGAAEPARVLMRAWGPMQVVVTRGDQGAVLTADLDSPPLAVPAPPIGHHRADACGAGDSFAAALTVALANGRLASEAVAAAVGVATAYVADGGPAILNIPAGAAPARPGTPAPRGAVDLARAVRAAGGTVVATGGCFDLLHVGHIRMLEQARALGDCLIVCLNSDDSVSRLKGASRPIVPAEERAAILAALASVDAVVVFDEDTPHRTLNTLRPDVWVKGGDYSLQDLPEAELVAELGGRIVLVPYIAGRSTTCLIDDAVRTQR